jgi:hypothetical protein
MVSHHELNNKWYISWDDKSNRYKAIYDKENDLCLNGDFRYWDDAYHALVKYNVLSKFNALKHKKMPVVRKAKLYCYYSILLVRNAFI